MMSSLSHPWDLSPQEAIAWQQRLAGRVIRQAVPGPVATIAGVDAGYRGGRVHAAVAILSYPGLELLAQAVAVRPASFPYITGLLSFREGPAVLAALEQLATLPDLLICDGHGLAHPRRFGLACHIGLLLDRPAIGCAKSCLCGWHDEPGPEQGSYSLLYDKKTSEVWGTSEIGPGEIIGAVVRTRARVKPVFVSIGHRVDLPTAITCVLAACRGYRLPEPIRQAHRLAG